METTELRFLPEYKVIVIDSGIRQREVDVSGCTNSATTLECVLQVAQKEWCTPKILFDFIQCLDQACLEVHGDHAVEVFCPGGQDRQVRWEKK